MAEREAVIRAFLERAGWGTARRRPLAGDASLRRYERLERGADSAVLMDAPPGTGEDVRPFLRIARHLAGAGLSAPEVLAADEAAGLLLLEDLGDAVFARVLEAEPGKEERLYSAAIETLAALHAAAPPEAPRYGPAEMAEKAALAHDWYLFGVTGQRDGRARAAFRAEVETALAELAPATTVLALRDYHAENLIWLPERAGAGRAGLLDFQDAALGHPAYDLVSLLKDARRDLGDGVEARMIARFLEATGHPEEAFLAAYAALGAQRNLRILGVFARLSLHYGKPAYVDLIPRVWRHMTDSLAHPALSPLAARVARDLPPPDAAALAILREKCATVPTA